jgi:glucokinase
MQSDQFRMAQYPGDLSCVIGIDLGGTFLKGGLVDKQGKLFYSSQMESALHTEPEQMVNRIIRISKELHVEASRQGRSVLGIGLSSTIDADPEMGTFKFASYAHLEQWVGFPITAELETIFKVPALLENDGIAATWGEYRVGAGTGYDSMLYIALGTGIGGGVILEGQRLSKSVGAAACFGHMSIDMNGPICACGNRGCWELYASAKAVTERAAHAVAAPERITLLPPNPSGRDLTTAATEGDPLARELLAGTGRYLGLGLVNLLNIFNPEIVVIGGGLAQTGEFVLNPASILVEQLRLPLRHSVEIRQAALGTDSGIIGAALLLWDRLSSNESHVHS